MATGKLLTALCVLLVGVLHAEQLAAAPYQPDGIKHGSVFALMKKLDTLVTQGASTSGATMDDLKAAHKEFKWWPSDHQERYFKTEPRMLLLKDFLFVPMERFDFLMFEDAAMHSLYVKRLEGAYKKFLKSYVNGVSEGNYYFRAPRTDELIKSLLGVTDAKPLTPELVRRARDEYETFHAKMREIAEFEDIYSMVDTYKLLMNYTLQPSVKRLVKRVFPLADQVKTDEAARRLKDIY